MPHPPPSQAIQRTERELAAADSHFLSHQGVALHYKRRSATAATRASAAAAGSSPPQLPQQPPRPVVAIHALHGFGASVYSWSMVHWQLAQAVQGLVTSHDMPGFGLSER